MFGAGDFDAWLKYIHIIAAVFWVGGSLLVQIYAARAMKAGPEDRVRFGRDTLVAGRAFAIAGVIVLLAGIWMVFRIDAWDWDQAWISIGFVGVAVGAVLGPAFYTPQVTAWIEEIEAGNAGAEARAGRIKLVSVVETVILLAVVWAMVFKPGL